MLGLLGSLLVRLALGCRLVSLEELVASSHGAGLSASVGIWLGKSLQSDEHLIGTDLGIRRRRSVWRRAGPKRWDLSKLIIPTLVLDKPRKMPAELIRLKCV